MLCSVCDGTLIGIIIVVIMVCTDIKETVTLEMSNLVYLKIKTYCFHCILTFLGDRTDAGSICVLTCLLYEILLVFVIAEPSLLEQLVITLTYAQTYFLPCDTGNFLDTLFCQILMETFIRAKGIDGISHCVNIPIIHLYDIGKNLSAARL